MEDVNSSFRHWGRELEIDTSGSPIARVPSPKFARRVYLSARVGCGARSDATAYPAGTDAKRKDHLHTDEIYAQHGELTSGDAIKCMQREDVEGLLADREA